MLALLSSTVPLQAQQVWDFYGEPEKGITVTGIVKAESGSGGGGSVKVFRNGKFFQEVFPGGNGQYEVDLPFSSDYELEFAMPGCVTKRIKVETNLPAEEQKKPQDPLAFNMSLPKATNGPLDEAYNTPVSRLFFDNGLGDFNRDMIAEERFRSELRAKQAEQKKWLEEQRAKEEIEKQQKRDEELAKKKAEAEAKAAAEAAAKKKAEAEAARLKTEADAKAAAEAEAKKKADADAKFAAEQAAKLKAEQEAAARRKAEEDAALKKAEEDAKRLAELAAQKDAEKKAQDELFKQKQKEDELRKLEETRQKQIADSLFKANEQLRLSKESEYKEAERKRKEEEDRLLWEKMNSQAQALEKKRKKEIADSIYLAEEKLRLKKERAEAEAKRIADEEANAAYAAPETENEPQPESTSTPMMGSGKSVYYQVNVSDTDRKRDFSAIDRAQNWERIKLERIEARRAKEERRREEAQRIKSRDSKKQRDYLEMRKRIEERRALVAEKNKQKEVEEEAIRQARLKETHDKKIVVLVSYSSAASHNGNMKFYGYVNFGDGKGPIELTESEYKEMASRFKGIYNKQP